MFQSSLGIAKELSEFFLKTQLIVYSRSLTKLERKLWSGLLKVILLWMLRVGVK